MSIPVIHQSLWKKLVERFQAPNPYITKKLGLQETPMGMISDYIRFPQGRNRKLMWINEVKDRLYVLQVDQCPSCLGETIRLDHLKGEAICGDCGYVVHERCGQEFTSYQQSHGGSLGVFMKSKFPRHLTPSSAKRVNHFKYWLQRLQGKERCRITPEEMTRLSNYLQDCNIDYQTIRTALKRVGLQKYYPNSYYLLRHFTGEALVEFTNQHEEQLVSMFLLIQSAFTRHAGTRVNMISYTYLIRKFSELLGWDDVVWSVPSMKSDANIHRQDVIWKKICEDVDFRFQRSVL